MNGRLGVPLSMGNHGGRRDVVPRTMAAPSLRVGAQQEDPMTTERDFEAKLAELDRLLNDPEVRMDPDRVWALLAEISGNATPRVPVRA